VFGNYIQVAVRRIVQNWMYTLINVFGLALGLSIFLFATTFANYERTYDSFFKNADQIYTPYYDYGPSLDWFASVSDSTRIELVPNFRELATVEAVTIVGTLQVIADIGEGRKFPEVARAVGPDFFTMFDFNFLSGSPEDLQRDAGSIFLSQSQAEKFFRDADPLGKTITIEGETDFRVAGVFQDVPKNSHFVSSWVPGRPIGFDMVFSQEALGRMNISESVSAWQVHGALNRPYLQVRRGVKPAEIMADLKRVADQHLQPEIITTHRRGLKLNKDNISIKLRPLAGQNLFLWEILRIPGPFIAEFLGLLVLAAAAMNYTGLAIAQVIGRSNEVAVRKTLGATRGNLFSQFMAESILIVVVAGLLTAALLEVLLPFTGGLIGRNLALNIFDDPQQFVFFTLTVLVTGFVAGAYPGLVLARMQVASIFSGSAFKGTRKKRVRNVMLVMQFALTAIFLACVAVMILQFKRAWTDTSSFDIENMMIMQFPDDDVVSRSETLKNELRKIGAVTNVSITSNMPIRRAGSFDFALENQPDLQVRSDYKKIDEAFFGVFNMKLLAGRLLTDAKDRVLQENPEEGEVLLSNIVINETMAKAFGWQRPDEAINQVIAAEDMRWMPFSSIFTIVGVVADFTVDDPTVETSPVIFTIRASSYSLIVLSLKPGALEGTMRASLREAATRVYEDVGRRIYIAYLRDWYQRGQEALLGLLTGFVAIAVVALGLSVVGLFGFAAFMAKTRSTEMSIRKVYGASKRDIVQLMLWQFIKPAFIGAMIGITLSYAAITQILQGFSNSRVIDVLTFVFVVGTIMLLAWGTTFVHALRVASHSPIDHLRHD